jgi:spore coat protein SA
VYNSVDTEKFRVNNSREDRVKILYAGRFDTGKGVEHLIAAIPEVIKKHGNCLFLFVGGGALRKWAENLARKLNKSNILFEGFVPYDRINRYYQLCDVVVVPSVWPEPFGRSIIEAMACGKPVIATKIGGIPELVKDGKTGLLVEPASSEEIANAITTLLDDEKKRERMGKRGRRIVEEKYNNEAIARKVLMVYKNAFE